ncbi:D-alanyl-D-alanine carboxypeptidase [Alysiella crassa]|uniref:D-alanyl-D-alanine carboxypeptidase n=2 Tax=Alysiella crassa TaxID=153491 RepID=A0A376BUA6_9NEIS|nr:D-alanyl-D-alanine carboxypeptidase [Alysiella crassa]
MLKMKFLLFLFINILSFSLWAATPAPKATPKSTTTPTLNQVSGMVSPQKDARLVRIPSKYANKTEYIQKNVLPDLERMILAARKDGVNLRVISAFRSYNHQKNLWQRKWQQTSGNDKTRLQAVLRYSSPPAFSRHHWGSDVDLNSLKPSYWASADGKKTLRWLQKNARKFGFCQVYSQGRKKGHDEEVWHWSHVRSARPYYQIRAKTIKQVKHINLSGSHVLTPELLKTYLSSIQNCGL